MLFPKAVSELSNKDIEEFCNRFTENIRVEYKSAFDQSVKKKIPRIVSAFANAYGGVLIIGVDAKNGVPQKPIEGISFADPEPRLTVENICRENIFPEVPIHSQVVPSSVSGKAFLVVEVNESPKAPHAIENSTQVYIRTGDSIEPNALANIELIDRLLSRRREVTSRWNEFYQDSLELAKAAGVRMEGPTLDVRIGPVYPTDIIISREKVFSFSANPQLQHSLGLLNKGLRHMNGALLVRSEGFASYLNIGELGTVHYLEPLRSIAESARVFGVSGYEETSTAAYPLWWITGPMLKATDVAAALMRQNAITCTVRIEARLINVSKVDFTLAMDDSPWSTLPVSTLAGVLMASVTQPSESLAERRVEIVTELLYQLRWPLGTEAPHTREQLRPLVEKAASSVNVRC